MRKNEKQANFHLKIFKKLTQIKNAQTNATICINLCDS